jgi:hypothetical protein
LTSVLTAAADPLESAVSKVKRHVLPLFLIMFIANYIDRVNIGFVNSHMQTDLGIGAAATGWGAVCSLSATRCSKCRRTY